MERVLSNELRSHIGQRVCVAGWLHRRRELKSVTFLILRDRQGIAQVVVSPTEESGLELTEEEVIEVQGTVIENAQAPGGVEMIEPTISSLSGPVDVLPFELFRPDMTATLPTQLDHASLALRHPKQRAMFAISATSVSAFRASLTRWTL